MPQTIKPPALRPGDRIRILSLASPVKEEPLQKGCEELVRLGYAPQTDRARVLARDSFFAGSTALRAAALDEAFSDPATRAIFCSRGGYGTNYLLDGLHAAPAKHKILIGSSDITSLQIFFWQKFHMVTFYGPMVASNFDHGAQAPHGYDRASLTSALTETKQGWPIPLLGKVLASGTAEGVLLGGCLTLIETSLGTPWELDTEGALLILEDRGMKPYQVDRALMHLKQAGKFQRVAGIILGDFPECEPPAQSDPRSNPSIRNETVEDVARRIFSPLGVPVVWGAPIGHTSRPALTAPLGVRARLSAIEAASATPQLEILEPACTS